jgi:putative IMPACT (imprinted ancient) family translation regulator
LSNSLTNVLVVVVRYFGGTLLGTGGLIVAYRSATADMLSNAKIIERLVEVSFRLIFPYDMLNAVMKTLKEDSISPAAAEYDTICSMVVKIRQSSLERFTGKVRMIPGLHFETPPGDD